MYKTAAFFDKDAPDWCVRYMIQFKNKNSNYLLFQSMGTYSYEIRIVYQPLAWIEVYKNIMSLWLLKLNFPMLCVLLFTCWLCPLIIMINCKQRVESWEFFLNKANPEPFKVTFCSTLTNVSASTGALTLEETLGWIFSAIDHL